MINLITTTDTLGLLQNNNSIPWDYPTINKRFKNILQGSILILGPNIIPNSNLPKQIIISFHDEKLITVNSLEEAIASTESIKDKQVWISGTHIINEALDHPLVTGLDLTIVPKVNLKPKDNTIYFPKDKLINFALEDEFSNLLDPQITHKIYRRKS